MQLGDKLFRLASLYYAAPISSDAPIYYWPYATVGVIVANIVGFICVWPALMVGEPWASDWWMLVHGHGLHPVQWITSMFMHADPLHLIGNMLFLWIFGLIVEGKLGWWKFLLVYLGVGVTQAALEQLIMLALPQIDYSLGASSAIYGLMAITLIWAPRNEITCFYLFLLMFRLFTGTFELSVVLFACLYVAFDILDVVLSYANDGSVLSTGWLHVTGAMVGLPVGIAMVKLEWVDCEGWDIFHAWNGELPTTEKDYTEIDKRVQEKKREREQQHLQAALEQFDHYLADGNVRAAVALYGKMLQVGDGLKLNRDQLSAVIRGLHQRQEWSSSAAFMQEFLARFPQRADPMRLKLAQICVLELQKPARALELLTEIDFSMQPPEKRTLAKKIARRAKQMQAEGVYELDDDSH